MKKDIGILYNGTDERTKPGFQYNNTITITGLQVLLQKITKLILTQVGTDLFSVNTGTNITTLLANSPDSNAKMSSYVSMALSQVEDTIKTEQAAEDLEDEERLVSIDLQEVIKLNASDWAIEAFVTNAKNESYRIRI